MSALNKKFGLPRENIQQLIPNMGGCYTTDRVTVDGMKVGYMWRELPLDPCMSGWTFMSGDETQEYADQPENWAIYEVNTICNCDRSIMPYLDEPYGSAFGRIDGTDRFEEEPFQSTED